MLSDVEKSGNHSVVSRRVWRSVCY